MLIVDVLKEAKEFLLKSDKYLGMCECIKCVCRLNFIKYTTLRCIPQNIPEFNYLYLVHSECMMVIPIHDYWWDIDDKQSRIEAFDKLIDLYKNSNKEWI